MVLLSGQARSLGYDPRTEMPVTLKLLQPGSILGGVNVVRGIACETAIASTESVCLTLNNQAFLELIRQYPAFKAAFQDQCGLVELFDLLGTQLERQAQGETDLRELTLNTISESQVYYVPPGRHKLSAHL